jgi:hypothetical protein
MVDRRENVSSIGVYLVMLLLKVDLIWRQMILTWVLSEGLSICKMLRNKRILEDLGDLLGILLGEVQI